MNNNVHRTAAIYARVSSEGDRQNTDRQVVDLQAYAASAGLEVARIFTEKASGARDDRPVLAECLDWCCNGNADVLLVSEISRLGRTVKVIVDSIDRLTKAGVNIHFQDINVDTLLPSGRRIEGRLVIVVHVVVAAPSRFRSGDEIAEKPRREVGITRGTCKNILPCKPIQFDFRFGRTEHGRL